jgi:hypothetical protein
MKITKLFKIAISVILVCSITNTYCQEISSKKESNIKLLNDSKRLAKSQKSEIDSLKKIIDDKTIRIDFKDWDKIKDLSSNPISDWLPSIIAILVVLLTSYLNYNYNRKQFGITKKQEYESQLNKLLSEFEALVYSTFGLMISLKQIEKSHPDKIDRITEFRTIYSNNSLAVKLMFEIKLLIPKDNKINSYLDEYLDKGIAKASGEETEEEIDIISSRLLELMNLIKVELDIMFKSEKK